jgi:hypothetical protein
VLRGCSSIQWSGEVQGGSSSARGSRNKKIFLKNGRDNYNRHGGWIEWVVYVIIAALAATPIVKTLAPAGSRSVAEHEKSRRSYGEKK